VPDISDDDMRDILSTSREYSMVFMLAGPNYAADGRDAVAWEHVRRNFELRAAGIMNIVGPLTDGGTVKGICVLNLSTSETAELMHGDPAVAAGILTYEVHPLMSFPGDALA
jgi:uncharacterized protein YciI